MPRGDGTGPAGGGPMTGRGAGYCTGFGMPGGAGRCGFGFGFGAGRGNGRRMFQGAGRTGNFHWSRFYDMHSDEADEKAFLKSRADILEKQLDQMKNRISQLESDN